MEELRERKEMEIEVEPLSKGIMDENPIDFIEDTGADANEECNGNVFKTEIKDSPLFNVELQ